MGSTSVVLEVAERLTAHRGSPLFCSTWPNKPIKIRELRCVQTLDRFGVFSWPSHKYRLKIQERGKGRRWIPSRRKETLYGRSDEALHLDHGAAIVYGRAHQSPYQARTRGRCHRCVWDPTGPAGNHGRLELLRRRRRRCAAPIWGVVARVKEPTMIQKERFDYLLMYVNNTV